MYLTLQASFSHGKTKIIYIIINKSDLSFFSNRQEIMGKLINKLMFLLEFPQSSYFCNLDSHKINKLYI